MKDSTFTYIGFFFHHPTEQSQANMKSKWMETLLSLQHRVTTHSSTFVRNLPKYRQNVGEQFEYIRKESTDRLSSFAKDENVQNIQKKISSNKSFQQISKKIGDVSSNYNINIDRKSISQMSKNVKNNIESSKKNVLKIGNNVSNSINNGLSQAQKMKKGIKETFNFSKYTNFVKNRKGFKFNNFNFNFIKNFDFNRLKMRLITYSIVGILSYSFVSLMSYLGITYLIRNRNKLEYNKYIDMFCQWLNIPYQRENETSDENKNKNDEIELSDYKINMDIKVSNFAYHATFYPRIAVSLLFTLMLASPTTRLVFYLSR